METSLRLRSGGGLRIHAKEKLPLGHSSLLQAHAELDLHTSPAGVTAPSYLALFVRHFYPQLSANLGAGVQLHNGDDLTYSLRAKKAVLFRPDNGFLGLNLKGRLLIDKEFKPFQPVLLGPCRQRHLEPLNWPGPYLTSNRAKM
ncbi:outer envelope pore protein 21, chloroplastic isoform X4 [Sorghum bicolor]|uniref:outer envelope pore protein 21, chloroplastic isoform X4 n=1 Tax=Sorghum bicolor TaxID=4558 RepID=UPI0001A861E9|nr:outer envelope pore protein 21, chloroplastic isoform X4 [Sorghum bicolor]|eukprot:XP_002454850.1 outer envelope pore protein 21, chloroplastic isoform X4 [Sorghum bicolor]